MALKLGHNFPSPSLVSVAVIVAVFVVVVVIVVVGTLECLSKDDDVLCNGKVHTKEYYLAFDRKFPVLLSLVPTYTASAKDYDP